MHTPTKEEAFTLDRRERETGGATTRARHAREPPEATAAALLAGIKE